MHVEVNGHVAFIVEFNAFLINGFLSIGRGFAFVFHFGSGVDLHGVDGIFTNAVGDRLIRCAVAEFVFTGEFDIGTSDGFPFVVVVESIDGAVDLAVAGDLHQHGVG